SGINANVTDALENIIRQNITSSGSYSDFQNQLRDYILTNEKGLGSLERYTKQITTDSISQYSRQYMSAMSEGLNNEWYMYVGSEKTTTREFCHFLVKKKYVHKSELAEILRGNIDGHQCSIYAKTKLPNGMIDGTNEQSILVYAGGYNCEHQFYPILESAVPKNILDAFKNKNIKSNEAVTVEEKTKDLDKKDNSIRLYSNLTGPLLPMLGELVNRTRKIITDTEKNQLIKNNDLEEITYINKSKLYSTSTQKIEPKEMVLIKKLLEIGHDVLFMPDGYFKRGEKKFDVIVFNKNSYFKADLKTLISKNPDSIAQLVSSGADQAGNVILDVTSGVNYKDLADGISSSAINNKNLISVMVFYKKRKITYQRNKILSKGFVNAMYEDFIKN
ncbi:MAG TPA: hypothetical protein P5509_09065, partial [Bacteroidales bacterium]|nr:hypothetical protein [Bacteroidales bacterium]